MGRCDLVANKWPLPTGGNVAEPDFHLIVNSMADKFSKVKHTGVIIGREFWGFWMAGRMGRVAATTGRAEVGTDGRHAGGRGGVGARNQIDHAIMIANGDAGMSIVAGLPRSGAGAPE